MKKKIFSLILALTMILGLAACKPKDDNAGSSAKPNNQNLAVNNMSEIDQAAYDEESAKLYDEVLGEFYDYYQQALESDNVSNRFALMAIAEAKLLESGAMLPGTTNYGNYAMTRLVPGTRSTVGWGLMQYRYNTQLVTTETIKAADYNEMRSQWGEQRGQGTYLDWVKNYLNEKGYTLKDTASILYVDDPTTWDDLSSSQTVDHQPLVLTYDYLINYNNENEIVPGLAERWEVSEDELTYTFHLREGVYWVDQQGRQVAEVVADDFVAGMQHMVDAEGGLQELIAAGGGNIKGAAGYISGENTDFSAVGVKAVDKYTVEYTLEAPNSFFITMLCYSPFAPLCRSYYESQGGKFGEEFNSAAADYTYGKGPDSIVYCGPYLVTSATNKNSIVFQANPSFWNKDNVTIKTLTWYYTDSSDAQKPYTDFWANTIDSVGLTTERIEMARNANTFDDYAIINNTDSSTYLNFVNLNRKAFANFNDSTVCVSTQTVEQAERTRTAVQNLHFRRALAFGLDRASWNSQVYGEELKTNNLRNTYIPGNFVYLEEDVSVDINGTATSFPAGTYYGEILQAQLDADQIPIKAWDPEADGGVGSSDGYDGWYNPEYAASEIALAIEELDIDISAENPIYIDLVYPGNIQPYVNRANAYKQSIETSLEKKVIVNLVEGADSKAWYNAGYYNTTGYELNCDVSDMTGWGPDYGDPQAYLSTMLPEYSGFMTKAIGLF